MIPERVITTIVLLMVLMTSCGGAGSGGADPENADAAGAEGNRNIVLIIIDTLRADHLSCYGYGRMTSPVLDSLAEAGTRWEWAQAQSPWTLPSHASIWTGLSVRSHGTVTGELGDDDIRGFNYGLDPDLETLPEIMQKAGFRTFGLANVCLLSHVYGFDSGFDTYSCTGAGHGRAGVSVDSLIIWLEANSHDRFFCMLHLYDVHAPYNPPSPYNTVFGGEPEGYSTVWEIEYDSILNPQDLDRLVSLYDGEIAWVDSNLGRLFRYIRRSGLDESTLIVVTADHGEEFLDHGWVDHGHTLYQEVTRVPMIMAGPGIQPGRTDSSVAGQYDLLPTLVSWAGVETSSRFDGTDILSDDFHGRRAVPASGVAPLAWREQSHLASIIDGSESGRKVKTIALTGLEDFVSYGLMVDPQEESPMPADSAQVEAVLYYWASPQIGSPSLVQPGAETINNLRDLGYIDD
jgi:arylsulfatase A-like enzyme